MKPVIFDFGKKEVTIDLDDISLRKRNQLIRDISKVTDSHHPLVKYPKIKVVDEETKLERDETSKEWTARVMSNISQNLSKNDGESEEDYEARVFKVSMEDDIATIAYEVFDLALKLVGQVTPQYELFEEANWTATRDSMFTLLSELNIPLANSFRAIN